MHWLISQGRFDKMKFNLYVKGCSACGKSHKIEFTLKPSTNEVWPYVGICPKTGEAVQMKTETASGG